MAANPMVQVGYNGSQYNVPKDVLQAGMAAQWIEDQLAEKAERQAQREAKKQETVEAEFSTIKTKLNKLDVLSERIEQLEAANAAYATANAAQRAQIEALEDSNGGLGSTSSKAREASLELSQQVAGSALMIETMMRHRESLEVQVVRMQERLDLLEGRQQKQIDDHLKAGQTRQRLEQEQTNRLIDLVAEADAVARKAEATAADALSKAQGAQSLNRNDISRDDMLNLIHAELLATTENIAESVVAQMTSQFPQGPGGIRMDKDFMEQTEKDGTNAYEIRYGDDKAMKRTLRKAQGFG